MKSIICNHFSAPENYVSSLEAALARLGPYILEEAQFALEYILETLRGISCNQTTVSAWGLSGPASFDVHLRWSAARLQEIVGTLRWALASLS